MYKRFYGLRDNPFRLSADPRFLYASTEVQETLAALTYGVQSCKGIVLLTGEVGTGKTTLVHALLDYLRQKNATTAYVFHGHDNAIELLEFILAEFGVEYPAGASRAQMIIRLNHWLLEQYSARQLVILIIDEAQNLSTELLEEVRLLTNLETSNDKLLQIVLVGQPELERRLAEPRLRQLTQRVAFWTRTTPLDFERTCKYVLRRLEVAGSNGYPLFEESALREIYRQSRGIPRLINLLCEHSLLLGYVEDALAITPELVMMAALEVALPVSADRVPAIQAPEPVSERCRPF